MKLIAALMSIACLTGCDGNPRSTEPGPLASAILHDGHQLSLVDRSLSRDDGIRRAAFARLQGMSRDEARGVLLEDVFTCAEVSCETYYQNRIGWWGVHAGVTTHTRTGNILRGLRITLLGDPIRTEADIAVSETAQFLPDP